PGTVVSHATLCSTSHPEFPIRTSVSPIVRFPCPRHNEFANRADPREVSGIPTARYCCLAILQRQVLISRLAIIYLTSLGISVNLSSCSTSSQFGQDGA